MANARRSILTGCMLFALTFLFEATSAGVAPAFASNFKVIYTFSSPPGTGGPEGSLVADSVGRLYGATFGGTYSAGTIYRLTPPVTGSGPWTEEILHTFDFNTPGSANPYGKLLIGPSGEVYGTTIGANGLTPPEIFRLDNLPGWPLTILHKFPITNGFSQPQGGLVFGPGGLLYGTTQSGGLGSGTVFSVSPLGDAVEFSLIDVFPPCCGSDSYLPDALSISHNTKLVGTSPYGGPLLEGDVYALQLSKNNHWVEHILYNAGVLDSFTFTSMVVQGPHQQLYGCAAYGGTAYSGGVFSLSPPARPDSLWNESILYNFGTSPGDPGGQCNIVVEPSGRLIGTTIGGGALGTHGGGTVFELSPPVPPQTTWSESVLHSFGKHSLDGGGPFGELVRLGGRYYGVALYGGAYGNGTVFEETP